jgi:hypothetical protein
LARPQVDLHLVEDVLLEVLLLADIFHTQIVLAHVEMVFIQGLASLLFLAQQLIVDRFTFVERFLVYILAFLGPGGLLNPSHEEIRVLRGIQSRLLDLLCRELGQTGYSLSPDEGLALLSHLRGVFGKQG